MERKTSEEKKGPFVVAEQGKITVAYMGRRKSTFIFYFD